MKLKLCCKGLSVVGINEQGILVSYSIEAEEYKQWLSEGNIPEPEFTDEELAQQELSKKKQEAQQYLADTAWYIERLADPSSGKVIPEEVLVKRAEAREILNELKGAK